MKKAFLIMLCTLIGARGIAAEVETEAVGKLAARIGPTFWSAPDKRLVRATTYKKAAGPAALFSRLNKSNEKISLRYATAQEAGTLAGPDWLPRGSMVKIHTEKGAFCYVAADKGSAVESRKAARASGKTREQRSAPVLDFCAGEQLWPDFIIVEIYHYAGQVPFADLTLDEQKTLFAYAMLYISKRE